MEETTGPEIDPIHMELNNLIMMVCQITGQVVWARPWENRCSCALLLGMQTGTAFLELNLEYLIKIHKDLPLDSDMSILGLYPKNTAPQIVETT